MQDLRRRNPDADVKTLHLAWNEPRPALLDRSVDAAVARPKAARTTGGTSANGERWTEFGLAIGCHPSVIRCRVGVHAEADLAAEHNLILSE